jgi:hypothetical protein
LVLTVWEFTLRGGKVPRGMCGSENEEGERRRRKLHNGKPHNFIHNKTKFIPTITQQQYLTKATCFGHSLAHLQANVRR